MIKTRGGFDLVKRIPLVLPIMLEGFIQVFQKGSSALPAESGTRERIIIPRG